MKKLLIIIVLFSSFSYGQSNEFYYKKDLFDYKIEIDGHITKEKIIFKATFDSIEFYDRKGNKYQRRKCNTEKCDILHLESTYSGKITIGNISGSNPIPLQPYILAH